MSEIHKKKLTNEKKLEWNNIVTPTEIINDIYFLNLCWAIMEVII